MKGLLDRDTVKELKAGGWKRVLLRHLALGLGLGLAVLVLGTLLEKLGLGSSICPMRIFFRAVRLLQESTHDLPLWQILPPLSENAPLLRYACPFCGMTRAHLAALRLDFSAALDHHPLFFLGLPYLFLLFHDSLFSKKGVRIKNLFCVFLTLAFFLCWSLRLLF